MAANPGVNHNGYYADTTAASGVIDIVYYNDRRNVVYEFIRGSRTTTRTKQVELVSKLQSKRQRLSIHQCIRLYNPDYF